MDNQAAFNLVFDLRRESRSANLKLRADVVGDRIVFSGGKQGAHSIDIGVSSQKRVFAHWEGYCENNGLPAPKAGDQVVFVGTNGKLYRGVVAKAGTKRATIDFHYRHGGAGQANVPFAVIRRF